MFSASSRREFVGTIEHSHEPGVENVIRNITSYKIPEKYWTAIGNCDHCKTERNRKDTYIVRNVKTGEFKQVGKRCLEDYTGLDAGIAAQYATYLRDLDMELQKLADKEFLNESCLDNFITFFL